MVVRSFVEAVDEHDQATAQALYPSDYRTDLDGYIRLRITHLGPVSPDTNDVFLPRGVKGVDVGIGIAGWARDGGSVGEDGLWTYTLAPIGPHRWRRIIDEGMP